MDALKQAPDNITLVVQRLNNAEEIPPLDTVSEIQHLRGGEHY